ncbi:type II secretion system F family protein [uncultured Luteimonas sp.]|uniref:type II secretion system F family protein n=1 Tax=uncultured Luteimonas sp. TaxID=453144 RepID=UPI002629ECE1|nr:type II secretion system F family protein [uncultured Luteimonas sp.]
MQRYSYRAMNADGVALDGEVVAASEREAARAIEQRGLVVLALKAGGAGAASPRMPGGRRARLRAQDVILALQELSTLLTAGVGLADAVAAQARSSPHPRLREAFDGIAAALRQGQPFSQALAAAGLPMPRYVDTLVRSGEKAGLLARALGDAASQMDYDRTVRGEMRQALTYPAVLVLAGVGAVLMMFTYVVPKFAVLLKRAQDLPWLASAVLNTGMFAREHFWLLAGGVAAAGVLAAWALRRPGAGAQMLEMLERVPVLGVWRVEGEVAAWARVLATLLGNRVPMLDALGLAADSVNSPRRRARLDEATRAVRGGSTLADALEEQATLSATGYNLVRVGERSGELPAMLSSLAKLYQESGRARMKQFLSLLEPIAILLIGGVIGLIMTGIILAITSANDIAV